MTPRWLFLWIAILCLIQGVVNWALSERLVEVEHRLEALETRR